MRAKPKSTITYFLRLQWLVIPTTLALMVWADRIVLRYHGVCLEERHCLSEREFKIRGLTSALISHTYLFKEHLAGVDLKDLGDLRRVASQINDEQAYFVRIQKHESSFRGWFSHPVSLISEWTRLHGAEFIALQIARPDWPRQKYPTGALGLGGSLKYVFDTCGNIKVIDYGGMPVDKRCLSVLLENECVPPTARVCFEKGCYE